MQSAALDPRIVEIGIEVNGQLKLYQDLNIYVTGTKFANANQNECNVKIFNLDKNTQDFILSETTPWNRNKRRKQLVIRAGRVSYGASTIFNGAIIEAYPTQPPDIGINLKALTSNFLKGDIVSRSQSNITSLRNIAAGVASDIGVPLTYQAQDKQIANYSFNGSAIKQVDLLGQMGGVDAYVDDAGLIVKDINTPLTGQTRILNVDSGMIGIPETTELGIRVKFLLDNSTVLGGGLQLQSVIYPALNGLYTIYKLSFDIASRDVPFYWIAEARRRQ